jgi:hypothetical protein
MATIRFGSNLFVAGDDFTVVGIDATGGVVLGAFGMPPESKIVWVTFKGNEAFLNADLADADGDDVLQIRENVITFNKDNVFRVELHPDNKIPPDRVVVINQDGETALDLRRDGTVWDFNGNFYHGGWHIVATPQGTLINPASPPV